MAEKTTQALLAQKEYQLEIELGVKFLPVTRNELAAVRKNKVCETALRWRIKTFSQENYFHCLDIKNEKKEVEKDAKSISVHTGYQFFTRKSQTQSAPPRLSAAYKTGLFFIF